MSMSADILHFSAIPEPPTEAEEAARYLKGMQRLVRVVQELSLVRDIEGLQKVVRSAARELTGADGATFVLRDGDQCFYADEDAIEPLWKGKRFPMEICVSGWVMLNKQPAVIEDIYTDPRVPHDAYRPTFVKSLATVPIRTISPIGAIGNFWARKYKTSPQQLGLLQALADTTAVAIENLQMYSELEQRVRDRTAELEASNEAVQRLSITDELTQLRNRRGFLMLAEQEIKLLRRSGGDGVLMFFDLDGLKRVNDSLGHEAGDRMISDFASALRRVFRESDIVGRLGGDEFCVLAAHAGEPPAAVIGRLEQNLAASNEQPGRSYHLSASAGWVVVGQDGEHDVDRLLAMADAAMYENKRRRRAGRAA
jgi:diguanylate cyclase (GGDEF)-like protein